MACLFCSLAPEKIVEQTDHLLAFYDAFPVTEGHMLVIPKVHRADYFELSVKESSELHSFLNRLRTKLCAQDPTISGFNIGMNCGVSAGQTVFHCHIHLIPRRDGDIEEPKGGVRGVIPAKQKYG